MEAAGYFETLVFIYQTILYHIPEDKPSTFLQPNPVLQATQELPVSYFI
jgi:hypothetical protein